MKPALVGLFVGGKATRFGGTAKGMLPSPETGEALVLSLSRACRDALSNSTIVLVGRNEAYTSLGLDVLDDEPRDVGPLGGLAALLTEAGRRDRTALAVAADLPFVTVALIARVAAHEPTRAAVAPRPGGIWQPLFARYEPERCAPLVRDALAAQRFAARAVLELLGDDAAVLPLTDAEAALLDDWDSPEDVARTSRR